MYERIKASSITQNSGSDMPFVLNYYMLISKSETTDEKDTLTEYGCEISLEYPNAPQMNESSFIRSISCDRRFTERLIGRLIDGAVTPCTLFDIVYDHISE
ncbi:MAG: hypothetical protein IJG50_06690 [Clostridia bacterium]|nr:hypothetical protein [Clostridia bacterium]